jgi:DNA-binding response OmpR family regulator
MPITKTLQTADTASAPLQCQTQPLQRILVVEDDSDIRFLNTAALTSSGYHVDAAEDGDVAWNILQKHQYDLVVTDNEMPKMTGVELLAKLHAARMALPVIMATGTLPTEAFDVSPWLRPAALMQKPYSQADLLRSVKEVLRNRQKPTSDEDEINGELRHEPTRIERAEGGWPKFRGCLIS